MGGISGQGYESGNLQKFAAGEYTGDGQGYQTITGLGFTPKALFIRGQSSNGLFSFNSSPNLISTSAAYGIEGTAAYISQFTSFGTGVFYVYLQNIDTTSLNENGLIYYWAAWG
jgi:hypothetical protein